MSSADLSSVQEAIQAGRFSEIAPLCDALELQLASVGIEKPEEWPYAIHMLGHIYLSDLNSARFLWKRIPISVKQSQPELASVWKIGQCMWTRDYSGVHAAARSFEWSSEVGKVVAAMIDEYSKGMLRLLSTAYSTISVADAAAFLGLTESEAITFTSLQGWVLDPASQMLKVASPSQAVEQKLDSTNLQWLTEYVFHLEH